MISKFYINILISDYFVVTLVTKKLCHAVHCTYSIEETKELSPSLYYSESMGVNICKRPSLYSDKHGGVKVKYNNKFTNNPSAYITNLPHMVRYTHPEHIWICHHILLSDWILYISVCKHQRCISIHLRSPRVLHTCCDRLHQNRHELNHSLSLTKNHITAGE